MAWPLSSGFGATDPQGYLRLLKRLLPDGYSHDPDGPHMTELEAYATGLWVARAAIDRAVAQSFQDRTTELLEEWERAYDLPNDAARTLEQRQARLVAAERSTAGASRARVQAALTAIAPQALAVASSRAEVDASAAMDEMIHHIGVELDIAEWADPGVRRGIARVLRRMLPARTHPVPRWRGRVAPDTDGAPASSESQLFVHEGASWGGTEIIGRSVLERQVLSSYAVGPTATRHREYAPLVRLDAADLNAIQDLTIMEGAAGAGTVDSYPAAGHDQATVFVAQRANATTAVTLDNSIDWRERYVMSTFSHSTTDIRPNFADTDMGASTVGLWSSLAGDATGGGGVRWTFGTNLHLFADDTTGALTFYNATGSAVSIVGTMVASPRLVP